MKCERCDKEASVHLTQVVNGKVQKFHLCNDCAQSLGVSATSQFSVSDILLGQGLSAGPGRNSTCACCGMTLRRFQKEGRLGCPACYDTFSSELDPVLQSMHYATEHAGRFPRRSFRTQALRHELEELESRLDQAVRLEKYEEAARLRDQLQDRQAALIREETE